MAELEPQADNQTSDVSSESGGVGVSGTRSRNEENASGANPQYTSKGPQIWDIRLRAFILGLLLIVVDNYWVILMEKVNTGPYTTIISIFANVLFILAVLALVNSVVRRVVPRLALSQAEMLLIYSMVAMGAALAGHDLIPNLVGMMAHPWQFASPENRWADTFIPYLPKWLSMTDPAGLKALYEGNSSLYVSGHWLLWLWPMVFWVAFIVALVFVMMCINTLIRKQWMERERLSFPLVHLPSSMTEPKGELWRNKLFWFGFAIAFGIDLLNGLAVYYPNVPVVNVGLQEITTELMGKPWNAMGWTTYSFYPFVIGIGYLLPADLSFSCWFFYWFWKMQYVLSSMVGMETIPDFPYIRHQAFGGYMAIILTLTWTSRGYLKQVWLRIIGRKSDLDDSDEPISYRTAALGILGGFIFCCLFMMKIGLSPWLAVIAFLIYFILATAIARMRAELGPPVHDLHFSGPDYMLTTSFGLGSMNKTDMIGLTYFYWFNRAYRAHPMPIGLEGMKMAQVTKSSQKKYMIGAMLAVVVGSVAAFWAYLHFGYALGFSARVNGNDAFANEAFNNLSNWWNRPDNMTQPNMGANAAMLGGFGFCMLLSYLRLNMFNWPFHPIGYAISGSWSMNLVWAPIAIAWLCKIVTLRFGGLRAYKTAVPFFLGLTLGEMMMGSTWSLIGTIFKIPYYSFWGA